MCSVCMTPFTSDIYVVAYRVPNDDDLPADVDPGAGEMAIAAGISDPLLRPLPPTPAPSHRQRSNLSHITLAEPDEIIQPRQRANSDAQKQSSKRVTEGDNPKPRKHRPLSWLPPSSKMSARASHLHKDSITSTVERNIISAPVLTSTTNAKVALAEGVHCGEMTTSGLATSSWHSKSGWLSHDIGGDLATDQFEKVQELQILGGQTAQPHLCVNGPKEVPKGPSERSASMNALCKVKDALTTRLRQASDPQTYRSVFGRDKFVRLGDDCQPPSPMNDKHSQNRTEGRNLGRDKIRILTGHRHSMRKAVRDPWQRTHGALGEEQNALVIDADDTFNAGCYRTDRIEHALDFKFENLETSFAKAVENLDFRIKRDKTSLTSLSSIFHSGRNVSAPTQTKIPRSQQGLPQAPCSHLDSSTDYPPHKNSPHPASDQLGSAQPSMGQCASRVSKLSAGRGKAPTEVYSFPYQRDVTSHEDIDKSDRTARAQRIFSRGHSNPLASHPDLTVFANQAVPPMPVHDTKTSPLGGTSGAQISRQELDHDGLERAPIYSPSLENLSQYDRNTPSLAPGSTNFSPRKLRAVTSRVPLVETPTRPPKRGTGSRPSAPKHHREVPNRSSDEAAHTIRKHDKNDNPQLDLAQSRDVAGRGNNHAEKALKLKDQNMKIGAEGMGNGSQVSFATPTGASRKMPDDAQERIRCLEH